MSDQSNISDFGVGEVPETNLYECEICGSEFDSAKGRGLHRSKAHEKEEIKSVYIDELQRLADELDRSPSLSDMNQYGNHSSKSYQNTFGSWNEALKQAGLDINEEQNIAKPDLREEMERLADELERTPTSRDMAENGKYSTANYSRKFGSWNDAVQEAGLEPIRERCVPKEELLNELDRVGEKLGHAPTTAQMKQYGDYGVSTYTNEFGTWNDAVREAGFDPVREKDISEADLIDAIHSLSDDLCRTPSAFEMDKVGEYSVGAYERRFGSWNNALQEAGFDLNNRSGIPDDELIAELRNLASRLDRTPRAIDMDSEGQHGSATYTKSFGSWAEALKKANLEHERISHPDHLDHLARSGYEVEVAEILLDIGVEYEYEGLVIEYEDNRTYTPDFVTEQYVIEVKGHVYRNEKKLAELALEKLSEKQYVVIQDSGPKIPADVHISWDERGKVRRLFE